MIIHYEFSDGNPFEGISYNTTGKILFRYGN